MPRFQFSDSVIGEQAGNCIEAQNIEDALDKSMLRSSEYNPSGWQEEFPVIYRNDIVIRTKPRRRHHKPKHSH